MSEQDISSDSRVGDELQFVSGIPVEPGRSRLVAAITDQVSICDNFSPCITWPNHKKAGRVEELWKLFKEQWKLPETKETKEWFYKTANRRWADFKSRKLKNEWFDKAPNLAAAKANRPEGLISATMWEELCEQFASISDPGSDGKSKSAKCRDSRKAVSTDHHWGRTSMIGWSHKHEKKFGKRPTVVDMYKKGYMGIDALIEPVGSSTDEGDTQEPPIVLGTPEQLALSVELEKAYEECIRDGSDESTANTIACQKVLGKTKILGIQGPTTKRAKSTLSSTREDEMKEEIESLKQQLQEQKEESAKIKEESASQMNQLQQNFEALLGQLRQQGFISGSSSQVPPSQSSGNEDSAAS